jgi:hypothetical protein
MGMNYYLCPVVERCPTCGKASEEWKVDFAKRHIGKSSYGWVFSLRVYPDHRVKDLEDWKPLFMKQGFEIRDECDKLVSPGEMLDIITNRMQYVANVSPEAQHYPRGPHGLLRHEITHGCWPGEGSWDCCDYEFS